MVLHHMEQANCFTMPMESGQEKYEPLPRWGHVSVAIGDKMYLWGGRIENFSEDSQKKLASFVEVFDFQSELWEQRSTSGTPPKGLYNCAYTSIGNKIFVYGGWDGLTNHGSLHSLDVCTMKWEELQVTPSPEAPMKMSGCGLVSYGNNKLILFGGYGVPVSGQQVQGVRFKTNKDSERGGASVSSERSDDDTITILKDSASGGEQRQEDEDESDEDEMKAMTNEVKVFDINENKWSSPTVSGECPPPCVDFSFTRVDDHRAVVFGGFQPDMGTTSDAYTLDMETWHWLRLGSETGSVCSINIAWPKGRDGHASCVLSGGPHPQVLVTGGWDKQNQLLYDAWVLDVTSGSWTELPGIASSAGGGARFWHTVSCFSYSENLKRLVIFGGCPSSPDETDDGESWDKLSDTTLVEVGHIEPLSTLEPGFADQGYTITEWVMLDSVSHTQMGQPIRRMKEMVLFTHHRAMRAESLAKDMIRKLETLSIRRSVTPSMGDQDIFASMASLSKDVPFWVVPPQDVEITPTEIGRGKWAVVRVARFRGERIAAKCLTNPIFSEENRKIFIECMDMAAKIHHHPNLLPFYGAILEGEPIILTELMYANLRVLADKNRLSYNQVSEIALDVAKGLHFLHSTKPDPIIHGDLTCTSVLVEQGKGNKWKAKLSDFMTAKFFRQLIASDPSIERTFSPIRRDRSLSQSMSPPPRNPKRKESITPSDYQDPSVLTLEKDVFCYGLVLVEVCTGSLPMEISLSFLIESIRWSDMNTLVKDCLDLTPKKRPVMASVIDRLTILLHAISIKSIR